MIRLRTATGTAASEMASGGLFTARRVEHYRAVIAERAAALIDQAAPAGRMDLVAEFARPLPFTVINDVLGVPPQDRGLAQCGAGRPEPRLRQPAGQ